MQRDPITCDVCGSPFIPHRDTQRFCSSACYGLSKRARIEIACVVCGIRVLKKPCDVERGAKYCSPECYHKAHATGRTRVYVKKYPNGRRLTVACAYCGGAFETHLRSIKRGAGKYCSRECKVAANTTPPNAQCETCGTPITRLPGQRWARKYCCWECRKVGMRGPTNPRFRNDPDYRGWDWKRQRQRAMERDKHACRHCGVMESLVVHHIVPWAQSHDNGLDNLLTLCRSCHSIVHYGDGHLNNANAIASKPDIA